jgi:hypothetical protein
MTVVAFVPDLMDRSRLQGIVDTFVSSPADLATSAPDAADVVVVDLGRPGVLDAIGSLVGPVIGFGSHVDDALLDAARAAGCTLVLPRSRFFRDPAAAIESVRAG